MFKKMKLMTKLITGIGGPMFLLLLIAMIGGYIVTEKIHDTVTDGKQKSAENYKYTINAHNMKLNIAQIQQWFTDISAVRTKSSLKEGLEKSVESKEAFLEGITEFKELYTEKGLQQQIQILDDMEEKFEEFYNTGKMMAIAYMSKDTGKGKEYMEEFDEFINPLMEDLDLFIEELGISGEISLEVINEYVTKIQWSGLVFIFIAMTVIIFSIILFLSKVIVKPLNKLMKHISIVAKGELDVEVKSEYSDEIGTLTNSFNDMRINLRDIIKQLKKVVSEITSYSTEMASTNEQIVIKANEEIKITSEASTSVTELTASIQQVANNAGDVNKKADKSLTSIKDGYRFIDNTIKKMTNTKKVADETLQTLVQLKSRAREIQEILAIINKISEKIDLLALNAAIEASGVGEAGKRFRIVADEMRKLADDSMKSAKQIEGVLTGIGEGIESTDKMVNENVKEVKEIMTELNKSGALMQGVVKIFDDTSGLMKEVSLATNQQAKATVMFSNLIENINVAANETVKGVENIKIATDKFIDISYNLNEISDKFIVGITEKESKDSKDIEPQADEDPDDIISKDREKISENVIELKKVRAK